MAIKYSEKVMQHFMQPQNVGDLPDANAISTEGSPACGDMVTFALKINPDTRIIEDIRFRSFGCASNIATASAATLLAKGKSVDEVKALKHQDVTNALDGLPPIKIHCSILAVDGLKSAIQQWEIERGEVKAIEDVLIPSQVEFALNEPVHPRTGKTIAEEGLIRKVEIEMGEHRVYVELSLSDLDERFAPALEEAISDKLSLLPGVKKVIVRFVAR